MNRLLLVRGILRLLVAMNIPFMDALLVIEICGHKMLGQSLGLSLGLSGVVLLRIMEDSFG